MINGALYTGLRTDADGETRYYMNGLTTYAGLIQVNGDYYYINSKKVAVKNCSYSITKTNDLLPEATYTFDADGKMVDPPTATAQAAAASVSTMAASSGYQVWVPGEPVTYNYVYNGDKLSQLTVDGHTLNFFYDASGTPMAVDHDGTTYYYATNIQGDVIAILNNAGTAVVQYVYDAWGTPISTTGTMASTLGATNPLRYRSYIYDTEYGYYYLQSRYYDPEVGRFLNADAFASTGQGLLGNNMMVYCNNSPVMFADSAGKRCVPALHNTREGFQREGATANKHTPADDIAERRKKRAEVSDFLTNTDEQAVLNAPAIAFYKGVPAVKLPIGTDAFSFGIIFLGSDVGKRTDAIETVRHEYGHAIHYQMAGALSYTVTAFVPSVIGYHFGGEEYQRNYYSMVYEYTADVLGSVNRSNYTYSSTTETWFGVYLLFSMLFL